MFGFGTAEPLIEDFSIDDVKTDLKNSTKLEDKKFGQKAFYFYKNATLYYLPFSCIDSAESFVFQEHHSCCSGDSTMPVPNLILKIGKQNKFIEFSSQENCEKAAGIINERHNDISYRCK